MRGISRDGLTDWARFAIKLGLALTEPKGRAEFGQELKDRTNDLRNGISSKYDDVAGRVETAAEALRGGSHWPARVSGFLLGLGVGAGVGILLAPASGKETRDSILGKSEENKDRAVDSAYRTAGRVRESVANMPYTGTEG